MDVSVVCVGGGGGTYGNCYEFTTNLTSTTTIPAARTNV